jgi:putative transposase
MRTRNKAAALTFVEGALKHQGSPEAVNTDGVRSFGAAVHEPGCRDC